MAKYKFSFSGVFKTPEEAFDSLLETSWSLAMSDFSIFRGLCTPAEIIQEAFLYEENQRWWLRHHYVPHPDLEVVKEKGGEISIRFVSCTGTNRVYVHVGRYTTCTYTVRSTHTAEESSAVAAFMAAGWTPDNETAERLRKAEAKAEAKRNAPEAYCWPVERFGRRYRPKYDQRPRKGAGRYHKAKKGR